MAYDVIIRQGTHGNGSFRPILFPKQMSRTVIFDESCVYDLKSEDQFDVNKLFGLGFFPNHMQTSARFGWNWNLKNEVIDIFSFVHRQGKFYFDYMTFIEIEKPITLTLFVQKRQVIFEAQKKTAIVSKSEQLITNPLAYQLHPYFGGNQFAPHDMKIKFF